MKRFNTSLSSAECDTAITIIENYRTGRSKASKLYMQGVVATHAPTTGTPIEILEFTYEASKTTSGNPRKEAEKDIKAISNHLKKSGFAKELVLSQDGWIGWQK